MKMTEFVPRREHPWRPIESTTEVSKKGFAIILVQTVQLIDTILAV